MFVLPPLTWTLRPRRSCRGRLSLDVLPRASDNTPHSSICQWQAPFAGHFSLLLDRPAKSAESCCCFTAIMPCYKTQDGVTSNLLLTKSPNSFGHQAHPIFCCLASWQNIIYQIKGRYAACPALCVRDPATLAMINSSFSEDLGSPADKPQTKFVAYLLQGRFCQASVVPSWPRFRQGLA